ncbi:MAG: SpoIIE family protein phosphatase [Lachnospiraceae bacterium]|nr:SpoIIE family protein phosphatase [Lachnospiraceae bacterium]
MKIGIKILLVILLMSLGTLLIISVNSYLQMMGLTREFQEVNTELGDTASEDSKEALQEQMEENLVKLAQKQSQISNEKLIRLRSVIDGGVAYLENLYANQELFIGHDLPFPYETEDGVACAKYMLAPGVQSTDEIQKKVRLLSNCEYVFGPDLENNSMMDNLYLGTHDGIYYRYSRSNLYNPDYDPRLRAWFLAAISEKEGSVWLDTYQDYYGKLCVTCAGKFRGENGGVEGVLATDVTVQDMLDEIVATKIGESGYSFVLDSQLQYLAHPDFSQENFDKSLRNHIGEDTDVLKEIRANASGIVRADLDGTESYIAYATLEETGWKLGVCIDVDEVVAPSVELKQKIDGITSGAQQMVSATLSTVMIRFIIFFAVVGIFVIMLSFAVSGTITRPIQKLARNVENIGQGNLDVRMEVESGDEVGELAQTFNRMLEDLQQYIQNLSRVTAEKERIGAELDVATNIQASMLPCIFPAFPEYSEFDIYASMNPAKEVGGDFYDFFLVDREHLAIVMADVSGKGVPAALFMVIAKTLIKNRAQLGEAPDAALAAVNDQLCENNEADMFVTVWLGVYEMTTGRLVYANAGHECPALMRAGGEYELIRESHDFVVGGMEGMPYTSHEITLYPGDKLFLYTDGVPEATNAKEELFGEERMLAALNACAALRPQQTLHKVREAVDEFVGEADQFDDLTMLAMEVRAYTDTSHR